MVMFWKKDKRNRLEKELNCEDRGAVSSHIVENKASHTSCGACFGRVHVVIKNDGTRSYACPVCLCFVKGYQEAANPDPEEKWLKDHKNLFDKN